MLSRVCDQATLAEILYTSTIPTLGMTASRIARSGAKKIHIILFFFGELGNINNTCSICCKLLLVVRDRETQKGKSTPYPHGEASTILPHGSVVPSEQVHYKTKLEKELWILADCCCSWLTKQQSNKVLYSQPKVSKISLPAYL